LIFRTFAVARSDLLHVISRERSRPME